MQITNNMKMADLIHLDYLLLQILSRFNIKLGCGDKTIGQVCRENKIDVHFFLEIVNSFHDRNYFPKKQLQGFPLSLIVDYLRNSHEHYLKVKIPYIEGLIQQLLLDSYGRNTELYELINKFFTDYRTELEEHIRREEEKTYPYVFAVEKVFRYGAGPSGADSSGEGSFGETPSGEGPVEAMGLIHKYSMEAFENEHDNVEDKLFDLKNLIIKYIPPPENTHLCHTILTELFRLESDLNDHARIEDKVLVPKVKFMEKWIHEHVLPENPSGK